MHQNEVYYVHLYSISSTYRVKINKISIKNKKFKITYKPSFAILDTASTDTYFPNNIYENIINSFNVYCSEIDNCLADTIIDANDSRYCFKISKKISFKKFINSLPTILIHMGHGNEKVFYWLPKDYLIERFNKEDNGKTYVYHCLGFSGKK